MMTQLELNNKFAEAYGVKDDRVEYGKAIVSTLNSGNKYIAKVQCEQSVKTIPINTDTLTLFKLCIEHGVSINFPLGNCCAQIPPWKEVDYKDHATKEAATCAAMFAALCKLKGIE